MERESSLREKEKRISIHIIGFFLVRLSFGYRPMVDVCACASPTCTGTCFVPALVPGHSSIELGSVHVSTLGIPQGETRLHAK